MTVEAPTPFEEEFKDAGKQLMEIYASGIRPFKDFLGRSFYFPGWFRRTLFTDSVQLANAITKAHFERTFFGVGRNDPCPCGSGKKFKRCCI